MFGLDKYHYTSDTTFMAYHFTSNGPRGSIQKIAKFNLIGERVYNFGFGDFDVETEDISDTIVSDNRDVDLIMGTVGAIIYDFTNVFADSLIFVQGTNNSRTRLYQMNINRHWEQIGSVFNIYGLMENEEWTPFQRGVNYQAFLGERKKIA
ncbi:hypothetical protein SAMN05428949_3801 [Chitinophaga sp. YR627]|uniref:DUF6934 family protein n=1 Tax=Chitinophaga sp. YR627 TaxID=1881041 RepID=UPI0008EEDE7F|nr:hypothetical protein [Chitinophaga sp. YR627]SFN90326.1 hypothetical protein SAMN05428949_3801 [Chitinophaga sp. YR627]